MDDSANIILQIIFMLIGLYKLFEVIFIHVKCDKIVGVVVESDYSEITKSVGFYGPIYKGFIGAGQPCGKFKYYYHGNFYTAYGNTFYMFSRQGRDCRIWVYKNNPRMIFTQSDCRESLIMSLLVPGFWILNFML